MHPIDWALLIASLVFIVVYGVWRGRGSRDITGYLLADKSMRWPTILLSVMATQASAITFLSTPGQAYVDGMRFVQFYFGLPLAMIVLSITIIPVYHRLKVYTAYEYLETRFDVKTRTLAAILFLVQRGLAAGLTIYAPAIILSSLLGWSLFWTNLFMGGLVIIYTASGGNKAVSRTHLMQMIIIFVGMIAAFFTILLLFPKSVSFSDALGIARAMGRLNTIDLSFSLNDRYTLWSGLLGGFFLQLSYFGTDQSQVARYLTGSSVTQSRLGLLFNGLLKVPMQFFILLLGVMVLVFFQFQPPPIFFNKPQLQQARMSPSGGTLTILEGKYSLAFAEKQGLLHDWLAARHGGDGGRARTLESGFLAADAKMTRIRQQAIGVMQKEMPGMDASDTNYIFLHFALGFLPVGLVGLVMAAIIAASMSSTAAELNSLASTSAVDIYRRLLRPHASRDRMLWQSRWLTVLWGVFAVTFAEYAARLGSLIEAVNILGSLFYGTILGIFLVAFFMKYVSGDAVFYSAILAEILVAGCFLFSSMSFLWYNVVGCLGVVVISWILTQIAT